MTFKKTCVGIIRSHPTETAAYVSYAMGLMLLVNCLGHTFVDTGDHFMTIAASFQMMGFLLLNIRIELQGTAEGISANMCALYMVSYIAQLMNTLFYAGYLPEDGTADYLMYQACGVVGLLLATRAFYAVQFPKKNVISHIEDKFNPYVVAPVLVVCLGLALLTHSNANDNVFLDCMWMWSLWLESVSISPQLWLVSKIGSVEGITSHFIGLTIAARITNGLFWIHLLNIHPLGGAFLAGIYATSLIHVLLCADYIVFFIRFVWQQLEVGQRVRFWLSRSLSVDGSETSKTLTSLKTGLSRILEVEEVDHLQWKTSQSMRVASSEWHDDLSFRRLNTI